MKKAKLALLCPIFVVLFFSSQAVAIDLYGFGSYWDKDNADGEWGAGVGLSLPFITERLRLDGRAYFSEDSNIGGGDKLTVIPFDLGLQVHILPEAVLDPYLLGGVSIIYADADQVDVNFSLGGYLGAGLDWSPLGSIFKLFGEAAYRFAEIDAEKIENIDISGFNVNVGLKIHF